MEFATDVLGDDIVQRTAGEALRNTVGHAVRPASTVVFTTVGLVFLVSSILAVGYARSTEQEVYLFEFAAKSFANNAAFGIRRIVSWPGRVLGRVGDWCFELVFFPVRVVRAIGEWSWALAQIGSRMVWNEMSKVPSWGFQTAHAHLISVGAWLVERLSRSCGLITLSIRRKCRNLTDAIEPTLVWLLRIASVITSADVNFPSGKMFALWQRLYRIELQCIGVKVNVMLTRLSNAIEAYLARILQRSKHQL